MCSDISYVVFVVESATTWIYAAPVYSAPFRGLLMKPTIDFLRLMHLNLSDKTHERFCPLRVSETWDNSKYITHTDRTRSSQKKRKSIVRKIFASKDRWISNMWGSKCSRRYYSCVVQAHWYGWTYVALTLFITSSSKSPKSTARSQLYRNEIEQLKAHFATYLKIYSLVLMQIQEFCNASLFCKWSLIVWGTFKRFAESWPIQISPKIKKVSGIISLRSSRKSAD